MYRIPTYLRSKLLPISRRWLQSILLLLVFSAASAWATEYHGLVTYAGLPVPGATVTVTQGGKKYVTVTDTQGFYSFPTLADGPATLAVEMTGFAALKQDVTIAADAPIAKLELKLLTLDEMRSALKPVLSAPYTVAQAASAVVKTADAPKPTAAQAAAAAANAPPPEDVAQRATDGLLVQGSVNNAATSQFTLAPRFGNTASGKSLYSYSLNVREENSALDAKSYSLAGIDTTKPQTNQLTGGFAIQGPLKIPHLLRNGPNIFVGYQRTENSFAETTPGLVPTAAERSGDLSALASTQGQTQGQTLVAPASGPQSACLQSMGIAPGAPIPGNVIPSACVSPIAQSLWSLYPQPNFTGNAAYNYQVPLVTDTHSDALNSNVSKTIGRKNQISGNLGALSNRVSDQTLLGFLDTTHSLGINATVNLSHTINAHFHWNVGYQFSRQSNRSTPYFQDRAVYGQNGLLGNDPDPTYGGPPTLTFTSGLAALSDGQSSFIRNQTNGVSYVFRWNGSPHNVTVGVDFRRQQFNYLSQANARGTLSFTGAATGSDVADFLLGVPATSAIGYGNADKYLRQTVYDAYLNDDWRVNPQLTVNAGLRYEYGAPITEVKQRLANLDVAPGFTAVAPVLASAPKGSLTGQSYPSSLTRPDRTAIEPRIGVSWRPIPGSSLLVSAGYGITYDTSVYQGIALDLAQQSPLATSFTYQNGAGCSITLNNAFGCAPFSNFGVDPNYRVGYLQTWNLKLQRDLPESIQMTAIYLGNKGSRGAQLFLPNTNPVGATNPCPSCPSGFEYLASGGGSTRESGQIQLRRRLKSGFTASVLYTYSKSIDDDSSLGGQGAATASSATIAQDWRNLRGERGLSTFDQRHLLNVGVQYTTGMGKGGGTLLTGWKGRAYKEWTVQTQITAGSGLPETPLDTAETVAGYNAFVRPNVTGASIYAPPAGRFLNPAAYTAPALGQWGNARRDSITGPGQFTLNAALVRTFRLNPRFNLDAQIASQNAINHVTYSSYITNINSTQFGLPAAANAMRQTQVALRLRF